MTYNQTGLVRYDAMVNAIAAAYEVDEVKDIRDRAKGGHAIGRAWIHAKCPFEKVDGAGLMG